MKTIENQVYEGERPLFFQKDLILKNIKILNGESAIKECENIQTYNSTFNGKYPYWHVTNALVEDSFFDVGARAAIWYSNNFTMKNCKVVAPKMFRRMNKVILKNVEFTDALETLWDCTDIEINSCSAIHGDYIFMNSSNIKVSNFKLDGNYSFQNGKNIEIKDSILNSKDAFWESENVTVINCELNGEYLGWHSKNLTLINCKISGTQPLCYAENLKLENCTFADDCDLAFEYSTNLNVEVNSHVVSIKNPTSGSIKVKSVGEIILNDQAKAPNNCAIEVVGNA